MLIQVIFPLRFLRLKKWICFEKLLWLLEIQAIRFRRFSFVILRNLLDSVYSRE
jgi:hypothetical protein